MSDDTAEGRLDIRAEKLRRLHRDWDLRRGGRKFPARADFNPWDLKYIVGNLSLIDVLRDPLRFVFRLHATGNAERIGVDLTGKEVAMMPTAKLAARVRAHYELVVATGAPVAQHRDGRFDERDWDYEVLVLPLSNDGAAINMLMSALVWNSR